jgi:large subunit ribosomal protein L13e
MPKHNNVVPNSHFHKDWKLRVKTWFNQASKKRQRAAKRNRISTRGLLRPVVRCPTIKYNSKKRLGRGFTLEELKAAHIPRQQAMTIGIAVDHRRRDKSEETFLENLEILKKYKARLILFPLGGSKKENIFSEIGQKIQQDIIHFSKKQPLMPRARKPEKTTSPSFIVLRQARADQRWEGRRKRRLEVQPADRASTMMASPIITVE